MFDIGVVLQGRGFELRRIFNENSSGSVGAGYVMILDSSMVEHAAVNRGVVGSSPTRGGGSNGKLVLSCNESASLIRMEAGSEQ